MDYEGTTGERPKKALVEKLMSGYLEALMKLAASDMAAFKAVQEVSAPTWLYRTDRLNPFKPLLR